MGLHLKKMIKQFVGGYKPSVSVIICTYDENRMADLDDCLKSLLRQDFDDFEVLVVVDHNEGLYKSLKERYDSSKIRIILDNSPGSGQASAMNHGIEEARGDIVCFIDDDAVASENWLSKMICAYDGNTLAVGGRMEPIWMGRKPDYLPEEFYWLVGATGNYLPSGGDALDVRNLWSSNISYRKPIFNKIGFFAEDLGHRGDLFQGEDAEFGFRILKLTGKGVKYIPEAVVYHKIGAERVKLSTLLKRAYNQGYAKAYIWKLHSDTDALSTEREYLKLLIKSSLKKLGRVMLGPKRLQELSQLTFIVLATSTVLLGFVVGLFKAKP